MPVASPGTTFQQCCHCSAAGSIVYVALGMTPWQALRTATVTAAELLGESGSLGTIAPGARADLVATHDDPLRDITATELVSVVMKAGVVVKH